MGSWARLLKPATRAKIKSVIELIVVAVADDKDDDGWEGDVSKIGDGTSTVLLRRRRFCGDALLLREGLLLVCSEDLLVDASPSLLVDVALPETTYTIEPPCD